MTVGLGARFRTRGLDGLDIADDPIHPRRKGVGIAAGGVDFSRATVERNIMAILETMPSTAARAG
jgi:hypothetical protein